MGKKKYKFGNTKSIQEQWDDSIREIQSGETSYNGSIDRMINALIKSAYTKMDKSPKKELDPVLEEFYKDENEDDYDDNIFGTDSDTLEEVKVPEEIKEEVKEESIIEESIEEAPKEEPRSIKVEDTFIPEWFKDMPKLTLPQPSIDSMFENHILNVYGFIQFFCRKCIDYLNDNQEIMTLFGLNSDQFESLIMTTIEDAAPVNMNRSIYMYFLDMIKWAIDALHLITTPPYAVFRAKDFNTSFYHMTKIDHDMFNIIALPDSTIDDDCAYLIKMDTGKKNFNIDDALKAFNDNKSNSFEYMESGITDFLKYASVISSIISNDNYYHLDSGKYVDLEGDYYESNEKAKKEVVKIIENQSTTEFRIDTARDDRNRPINFIDFKYTNILYLEEEMNALNSIISDWKHELSLVTDDEDTEEVSEAVIIGEDEPVEEAPKASPMEFAKHYHDNTTHEVVRHEVETIGDDIEIVDEDDIDFSELTITPVRRKK